MLLLISFIATFCLIVSAGLLLFHRDAVMGRLQRVLDPEGTSPLRRLGRTLSRKPAEMSDIIRPFQDMLPRSAQEVSIVQKRLIRAGYRGKTDINIFYAAKVIVPLALAGAATAMGAYELGGFFAYATILALGFLAPDFWVGNRMASRAHKIRLGLPEALDMMVVCTEAGLGLDQAIIRVAEELRWSQPEIREELVLINLEQKAGRAREEALLNFADRTDIDVVRALANTLIQSDTFGTSVAKTLRVYSETLRTQRRQSAEEQAAKTTVKLVFPLVFFIFPAVFVVALGPSAIALWEGLEKAFG
jgi:tight adherence protein C